MSSPVESSITRMWRPGRRAWQRTRPCPHRNDEAQVVARFVGAFCGPRARMPRVFCSAGGKTRWAGLKRRRSAAVSSRTSPSSSISGACLVMALYLPTVGFAKADDTNAASHWGKEQHMQALVQKTHRYEACFRVVLARVLPNDCGVKVEFCRPLETQLPVTDVGLVLGCVEFNVHGLYCNDDLLCTAVFCD